MKLDLGSIELTEEFSTFTVVDVLEKYMKFGGHFDDNTMVVVGTDSVANITPGSTLKVAQNGDVVEETIAPPQKVKKDKVSGRHPERFVSRDDRSRRDL